MIYDIYAARENLSDLIAKIPSLKNIKTLPQLGNTFAEACGGSYTDQFEQVTKAIEKTGKDTVIVVYSAGDVDYQLRKFLRK